MRFTTLAGLANELQEAESRRELGYLGMPDGAAELVFQVLPSATNASR